MAAEKHLQGNLTLIAEAPMRSTRPSFLLHDFSIVGVRGKVSGIVSFIQVQHLNPQGTRLPSGRLPSIDFQLDLNMHCCEKL